MPAAQKAYFSDKTTHEQKYDPEIIRHHANNTNLVTDLLSDAVKNNDLDRVKALIYFVDDPNVEMPNKKGEPQDSLLTYAIRRNQWEIVQALLASSRIHSYSWSQRNRYVFEDPLSLAVRLGLTHIVEMLLKTAIDNDRPNLFGDTETARLKISLLSSERRREKILALFRYYSHQPQKASYFAKVKNWLGFKNEE